MISVVLATYGRSTVALRCLQSLETQDCGDFEVVVVDNKGERELQEAVTDLAAQGHPFVYVCEPRTGVHFARHKGAKTARGDLLAFIDDDALAAPGWLSAFASAFKTHPEMMAAGGRLEPEWEAPPPGWLDEYAKAKPMCTPLGFLDLGQVQLASGGAFFSGNMAIRREALFTAGGFNPEAFGRLWLGDGETGLARKLTTAEYPIGYVPEALVYHTIPVSKMGMTFLRRRAWNQGMADGYTRYHPRPPNKVRLLLDGVLFVVRSSVLSLAALVHRDRLSCRTLELRSRAVKNAARARFALCLLYSDELRRLVGHEDWLNRNGPDVAVGRIATRFMSPPRVNGRLS